MAYREPGMVHAPPPDFSQAWRRYRLLRWLSMLVLMLPSLSMIAVVFALDDRVDREGAAALIVEGVNWLVFLMMLASLPAFVYCIVRMLRWPCPNCGQPFFRGQDFKQSMQKRKQCIHCGLRQWAKSPPLDEMPLVPNR
jgi:hypothetical protein